MSIKKTPKRPSKVILGVLICIMFAVGGYYFFEYLKPIQQKEIDADVVAIKIVPTETIYSFFTQDQKEIQKIYSILSSEYNNDHARDYDWSIVFYKNGEVADTFWINEKDSEYHLKLKPYLLRARESKQKTSELKVLLNEMLPYKLVYSKDGFEVRETQILDDADYEAEDYFSLENVERIENTEKNYTFQANCYFDEILIKRCVSIVETVDYSGEERQFSFARGGKSGEYVIKKDDKEIWRKNIGNINAPCSAIRSVVQVDDKLAVDYYESNRYPESARDSVLLIQDEGVDNISKEDKHKIIFSPHNIRGEVLYFEQEHYLSSQTWLNYDDEKVTYYEEILTDRDNDHCKPSVFADGNAVDFFARKDGKVFHVQAGYFDGKEYLGDRHYKDEQGVYVEGYDDFLRVIGADPEAVILLGGGYMKGEEHIFYMSNTLKGVDYETFEVIGKTRFAKDKNQFYYSGRIVRNESTIDSDKVKFLNHEYAKDENSVYYIGFSSPNYFGLEKIEGADPDTFEVLSPKDDWYAYAKDRKHVYYRGGKRIDQADVRSFEVLIPQISKDKNHVFMGSGIIDFLDAATFEIIKFPFAKDKNGIYNLKNDRSIGPFTDHGRSMGPIEDADAETFEPLFISFGSPVFFWWRDDDSICYDYGSWISSRRECLDDADPETFQAASRHIGHDKNSVYCIYYKEEVVSSEGVKIKKLEGVDPKDFDLKTDSKMCN